MTHPLFDTENEFFDWSERKREEKMLNDYFGEEVKEE